MGFLQSIMGRKFGQAKPKPGALPPASAILTRPVQRAPLKRPPMVPRPTNRGPR